MYTVHVLSAYVQCIYKLMRDAKGRKREASKARANKQQGKATQHRQSLLGSRQSALPAELPRQLSWPGPNLTSHSTPDEQANYQLSMKPGMYIHVYVYVHVLYE